MSQRVNYLFYIIYFLLFTVTCNNCFFWDTIQLASKHATFFYNTNFSSLILPDEMDSGHPPFLSVLLAASWKLFGRTLFVSHLLMLPFVLMIVYQTITLTKKIFPSHFLFLANGVILSEATLMTQCTLVSPDVILVAFFLFGVNAILSNKPWQLTVAILFLCIIGMRGMMCTFILFCFHLYYQYFIAKETKAKTMQGFFVKHLAYVPGVFIACSFLVFHFLKTGWIGYHINSPWAFEFEKAPAKKVIFNFFILCWRMIDFGKIITYLLLGVCIFIAFKKKNFNTDKKCYLLLVLSSLFFLFLALPLIRFNNLLCHRYILPLYISVNLLVIHLIIANFNKKISSFLLIAIIISQLTGNLWVYPKTVATGWDATLSHLPYYSLRKEALNYINSNNINLNTVGTGFPNIDCQDYVDLTPTILCFVDHNLKTNKYILYSNIFNDFNKTDLEILFKNWKIETRYKKGNVEMVLFKRPE